MHEHNRYLGQDVVLYAHATGRSRVVPHSAPGHLQHDWDAERACDAAADPTAPMLDFVWSEQARAGRRRAVVIGAPWLYLPPAAPEPDAPDPAGTLWVLQHGLGGARTARDLAAVVRGAGPGPHTVLLPHGEGRVPGIREVWEHVPGLTLLTLPPAVLRVGDDGPGLLAGLHAALSEHLAVVSNAPGAHLLYAAQLGLPVRLAGPAPTTRRPAGRVAELTDLVGQDDALADFARAELGAAHRLSPAQLADLMDWNR